MRRAEWHNPWEPSLSSRETFFDLYDKAQTRYLSRMDMLSSLLYGNLSAVQKKEALDGLLSDYGNLSFHSGLDAAASA